MTQKTRVSDRKLLSPKLGVILEFIAGDEQGREVPLMYTRTLLGRKEGDILVRDIKVSSTHIAIHYSAMGFEILDLESSNGTLVDGKKVSKAKIHLGTNVQIGDTVFRLSRDPEKAAKLLKGTHARMRGEDGGMSGLLDREFIEFGEATAVGDSPSKVIRPEQRTVRITVLSGPNEGEKFAVKKAKVSIGRVNSDIVLKDPDVSRKHAMLEIEEGGQIVLRDLASSNGTFVNKIRITNCILTTNDQIQIGKTVLLFEGAQGEI